jgi:hypothetical protein
MVSKKGRPLGRVSTGKKVFVPIFSSNQFNATAAEEWFCNAPLEPVISVF